MQWSTSAELPLGDVLFPGDSITYEMDVPAKELPHIEFRVEGTVSRRHLSRVEPALPVSVEQSNSQ